MAPAGTWLPPLVGARLSTDIGEKGGSELGGHFVEEDDLPPFRQVALFGVAVLRATGILVKVPYRHSAYPEAVKVVERNTTTAPTKMQVRDIQTWTGWSDRRIASVIGSTHPTVSRLRTEGASARVRNRKYRTQLERVHQVISRIYTLAGSDQAVTRAALEGLDGEVSAADLLESGQFGDAYIRATRRLVPQNRIRSRRMPRSGRTVSLEDREV
jgi:hypothetical protein